MCPYSDVDLLFLIPWKTTGWSESLVESVLYILWDLHLKVGQATRRIRDCAAPRQVGHHDPHRAPRAPARRRRCRSRRRAARAAAHATSSAAPAPSSSRPSSPSGTRATSATASATWSSPTSRRARAACATSSRCSGSPSTSAACATSPTSSATPSRARSSMPSAAPRTSSGPSLPPAPHRRPRGRPAHLRPAGRGRRPHGLRGRRGRRAVEHFMQDYFRHATRVGELTRIFLTALEERHVKPAPRLERLFRRRRALRAAVRDPAEPPHHRRPEARSSPSRSTSCASSRRRCGPGLLLHPDAMRLIAAQPRPDRRPRARRPRGQPRLPRHAAAARQPRAGAAADERARRPRRLHPRVRAHRRDDAVQHVPPLHGGRAHHPVHLPPRPDREGRARRGAAGRHRRSSRRG